MDGSFDGGELTEGGGIIGLSVRGQQQSNDQNDAFEEHKSWEEGWREARKHDYDERDG